MVKNKLKYECAAYPLSDLVHLDIFKVAIGIKMFIPESPLPDDSVRHFTLKVKKNKEKEKN